MQAGRPVFLAQRTSLPEIAGDLGFYWKSFDPDHMLEVVRQGIEVTALDPGRSVRLQTHAQRFSWERAARDYLRIYSDILARTAA